MSGICGIVTFDQREAPVCGVENMIASIAHRGPEHRSIWAEGNAAVACRGETEWDGSGDRSIIVVFDGFLTNIESLRSQLSGTESSFRNATPERIIAALYDRFGEKCAEMLRGSFAFAVWNSRERTLYAARDHFGIKPFYYYNDAKRFVFGSEIKSLLRSGEIGNPALETESLLQYLTFQYVPEPLTMFRGIHKLRPGHFLTVDSEGRERTRQYWDPSFMPEPAKSMDDLTETLREKLRDSLKLNMFDEMTRGCFLSSGIDSASIAALMRQSGKVKTFSVGFEGEHNETIVASQVAKALGTDHQAKLLTDRDYFDAVNKAVWHQDEPLADPSAIGLYLLSEFASPHAKVIFSGEGADELFGGYRIYREPYSLARIEKLPMPLKPVLRLLAACFPEGLKGKSFIERGTTPLERRFVGNARIFSEDLKGKIVAFNRDLLREYNKPFDVTASFYAKTKHLDPVTRMQYIDMNLWLPGNILMKADKMTSAHSLQVRTPFLDVELFEFARRIPVDCRIAHGTTKYILRKAMEGIVPDVVLHRPKLGFPIPLRSWLRGSAGDLILEQIKSSGIDNYIRIREAEKLLHKHRTGRFDHSRKLWVLYIFALWHQTYMKGNSEEAHAYVPAGRLREAGAASFS